jgi:hypothetical protein
LALETIPVQSQRPNQKETLYSMKDNAILGLSNLLSYNIDIGLKSSLPMGYHEDSQTRGAFIQVLTNVLKSGNSDQFAGVGDEGKVMTERYERLVDLVTDGDFGIIIALCEVISVNDIDAIADTLINVFQSRCLLIPLIKAVITNEIMRTGIFN